MYSDGVSPRDVKKSRKIVEYGIEALKAVWHRGAIDADGKTGAHLAGEII